MAIIAKDEALRSKGGGGKLNRSETVTVRLDPKLNYLCELAARAQRRTKSSFIEWSIENTLKEVGIPGEVKGAGELWTIANRNSDLWDVEEPDRLVALATYAPSLLTHDEQVIWKMVTTSAYLWRGRYEEDAGEEVWRWDSSHSHGLIMERLREVWDAIKSVAVGQVPRSEHWQLTSRLVRGQTVETTVTTSNSGWGDGPDEDIAF